jgi:uncharacterized protein YcbK (DUF882 family)
MFNRSHIDNLEDTSRRSFLRNGVLGGAVLGSGLIMPSCAEAARVLMPSDGHFSLSLKSQNTGDTFNGVYRVGNRYIPDAFKRINYALRDFRHNEVYPIDPRLLDILFMVRAKTGRNNATFEVLSGYRSPQTNSMLRRAGTGSARNSLHLTGQAIDIRMAGVSSRQLNDIAKSLSAGGVGYYPRSNFLHFDTGRVRHW